jgi:hypothetical protein
MRFSTRQYKSTVLFTGALPITQLQIDVLLAPSWMIQVKSSNENWRALIWPVKSRRLFTRQNKRQWGQARWVYYARDISGPSLDVCSSCYYCVSEFEMYESVHVLSYILRTCLEISFSGAAQLNGLVIATVLSKIPSCQFDSILGDKEHSSKRLCMVSIHAVEYYRHDAKHL